ncbi:hypothetical protein JCM5350_006526 [Sporobolomyces pararoseus]
MSTSSSSTQSIGECVVCGKSCSTRCGECSKHGTDWMFFCSTEHQRLVWFVHSRVCGPRSKPFRFPAYNRQEEQDTLSMIQKLRGTKVGWMRQMAIEVKADMIDYRELEGGPIQLKPLSHHRKIVDFRFGAIDIVVASLGMHGRAPTLKDVEQIMETNLLNLIAWQYYHKDKQLFELYDSAPWFDKFQHLYFLYRTISKVRASTRGPELEGILKFEQYTHRKWREFVDTEVRSINPEVADVFHEGPEEWKLTIVPNVRDDVPSNSESNKAQPHKEEGRQVRRNSEKHCCNF